MPDDEVLLPNEAGEPQEFLASGKKAINKNAVHYWDQRTCRVSHNVSENARRKIRHILDEEAIDAEIAALHKQLAERTAEHQHLRQQLAEEEQQGCAALLPLSGRRLA